MRLVFTGADEQTYADARTRIVAEVAERFGLDPAQPPAVLLEPVLDSKYGVPGRHQGDGRLALWRTDDVRRTLQHHLPRELVSPVPEQATDALLHWFAYLAERDLFEPASDSPAELRGCVEEMLPEFRTLLADPARYSFSAFLAQQMAASGVDGTDEKQLAAFVDDINAGRADIETDILHRILDRETQEDESGFEAPQGHVVPVADVPGPDEASLLAAQTPLVTALRALDDVVGAAEVPVKEYRELTAEGAERVAHVAVPGLSAQRVVDIAAEIGLVRPYRGRLVQVKKNRSLARQPERLWARAFGLLPEWDRISVTDPEDDWSAYLVIDPDGEIAHLLCAALYREGTEGLSLAGLARYATSVLAGLDECGDQTEPDEVGSADESVSLSVRRMGGVLVALGAAERFMGQEGEDCLRASPAGIRGLYDFYRAQGFTAYSCAELAAESAELVVALVASGLAGDEAVASWSAARSQRQAATELADLAERTDDSEHRAIALHMVVQGAGETGLDSLYERADSEEGGCVRSWLASNGYLSMEKLSADDWLVGLLDNLEFLIGVHDPQPRASPQLPGAASGLADTLVELPRLVRDQSAGTRVRAWRIAEELAQAGIDPEITAAAESALAGLRE